MQASELVVAAQHIRVPRMAGYIAGRATPPLVRFGTDTQSLRPAPAATGIHKHVLVADLTLQGRNAL